MACLAERGPEPRPHAVPRQGEHVLRGVAGRHLQVAVDRAQRIQAFVPAVDQDRGRGVGIQNQALSEGSERCLGVARPGGRRRRAARLAGPNGNCTPFGRPWPTRRYSRSALPIDLEPAASLLPGVSAAPSSRMPPSRRAKSNKRQHPRLRVTAQVDQQVAAGDEIEPGERRVGQHVLDGEHHHGRAGPAGRGSPARHGRRTGRAGLATPRSRSSRRIGPAGRAPRRRRPRPRRRSAA